MAHAGSTIPDGIESSLLKEWENTGFIHQVGSAPVPEQAAPVVRNTGRLAAPEPIVIPPEATSTGKFNLDPAALEGKALEELNLLLADLDTDAADTVEEAIGLLSADFKD